MTVHVHKVNAFVGVAGVFAPIPQRLPHQLPFTRVTLAVMAVIVMVGHVCEE